MYWLPKIGLVEGVVTVRRDEENDSVDFKTDGGSATASVMDGDMLENWLDTTPAHGIETALVIDDIKVNASQRGSGTGSALMLKVLEYAKKEKVDGVFLNASPLDTMDRKRQLPILVNFYEKFGFKVIEKHPENAIMLLTL